MKQAMSYEEGMQRLEQIVSDIEEGNVPVDELAAKVREGAAIIDANRKRLRTIQKDVESAIQALKQRPGEDEPDGAEDARAERDTG